MRSRRNGKDGIETKQAAAVDGLPERFSSSSSSLSRSCMSFYHFRYTRHSPLDSAGITLAFTIPRVPGLNFNTFEPLQPATGTFNSSVPTEFSRAPANFSFPAFASIQVDTSSNYLPLTITKMTAQVFDTDTGYQVATSILEHQTFAAKTFSNLNLPLNFSYVAENSSDITCELSDSRLYANHPPIFLHRDQLV